MNTQIKSRVSIKSILLGAIGGQGGNVLIEWLFLAAELDGRRAQALSLPGLSQRGGGTNFYLEIASLENSTGDKQADAELLEKVIFAQFPFPGRVDVLLGQELVELGRMLQGGFASRQTAVVASSQRIFTIDEKMPAFDGVFPSEKIIEAAATLAGSVSIIDTLELATQNGLGELATNAMLLGALSAIPDALPMPAERYREAIQEFGLVPEMNLKAFEVGRKYQIDDLRLTLEDVRLNNAEKFDNLHLTTNQTPLKDLHILADNSLNQNSKLKTQNSNGAADSGSIPEPEQKKARRQISLTPITKGEKKPTLNIDKLIEAKAEALPKIMQKGFWQLAGEVQAEWPSALQNVLIEAIYQVSDYQNLAYARRYLKQIKQVLELEPANQSEYKLTQTYAKTLAMRMTYEDAVRVASLKIKPGRLERIRRDMGVKPGQVLEVTDYLKPDAAEIYGIMPYFLVEPMLLLGKVTGLGYVLGRQHFTWQQYPKITTLGGFMTFKFLTWWQPLRLSSYRFCQEWKLIENYTEQTLRYARQDYNLGVLVAESGRLVKGYGDTRRKMIKTIARFYNDVLAPLYKWEDRAKAKGDEIAPFAVTHKTTQLALQLIGRSDDGIDKAETLAKRVLTEAKNGQTRSQLIAQIENWARDK